MWIVFPSQFIFLISYFLFTNGEKGSKPKGYKRVRLDNDLLVGLKLYSKDGQEVSSWLSGDVIKHMIDLFHIGGYDQILVSENLIESKAIIPSAPMVEKEKVSENLKALSLMAEAIDQS